MILDKKTDEDIKKYISLFKEWNKTHKMTSSTNNQKLQEYIDDSLYPISFLKQFNTLLDVGSGAGFPAIILAIALKDKQFYLIEPNIKKFSFLNYVKVSLGLKNLTIFCKRVEDLDSTDIDSIDIDVITSKALTNTKRFIKISSRLLKSGVDILLYKGNSVESEVEGLSYHYKIYENGIKKYLLIKV